MPEYTPVDTSPVKRFFVEMLTRDIAVDEAILDLLDNCVDGILRGIKEPGAYEQPYGNYWAQIRISKSEFQIEDNCGGIPWSEHHRAFRMGRPSLAEPAEAEPQRGVGVYGIGMKRAIFKMGSQALIRTQNGADKYEIEILPDWIRQENNWDLEVKPVDDAMAADGTLIMVNELHEGVSELFNAEYFEGDLINKIRSHYAVIIQKGFRVEVNGKVVEPRPIQLRFSRDAGSDGDVVQPYVFKGKTGDVDVFLAVGLREPIPEMEKTLEAQEGVQYSSDFAGWTVICNDRVVLYCNRDELTGWGTAGIPRYHTQFIAISGVVEFTGPPLDLPTTTTKRGLNFSSRIYQQVLERMREGLRIFVDFTNQWKTRAEEVKARVGSAPALNYSSVKEAAESLNLNATKSGLPGQQYRPKLPRPPSNVTEVRISYMREKARVHRLGEELLEDFEELKEKDIRRRVGEASFDYAYKSLVEE